jgi:hypothetical protein
MSRHRTTAKMHRVGDRPSGAKPVEDTVIDSASDMKGNGAGDEPPADRLTADTLGRYLAAEISLRESGEERTAGALARYFKLTLVLSAFNMVVATASVIMLFSRADKPPTIVVAPPVQAAAPAPQPPPVEKAVMPEAAAPAPMSPAPPAALPPAPSPSRAPLLGPPAPASRMPLLGQPPSASRRAAVASAPRLPRVATPKPAPSLVLAKNAAEEAPQPAANPAVSQATERW